MGSAKRQINAHDRIVRLSKTGYFYYFNTSSFQVRGDVFSYVPQISIRLCRIHVDCSDTLIHVHFCEFGGSNTKEIKLLT